MVHVDNKDTHNLSIFISCSSPIFPTSSITYKEISPPPHRPPYPRHCLPPRPHRRVPLLPPADQRNRRAGMKRSRTVDVRMHKRYQEGFCQPLAFNAEGQDLRADGPAFAGVSPTRFKFYSSYRLLSAGNSRSKLLNAPLKDVSH
jgi:hypothetical protein